MGWLIAVVVLVVEVGVLAIWADMLRRRDAEEYHGIRRIGLALALGAMWPVVVALFALRIVLRLASSGAAALIVRWLCTSPRAVQRLREAVQAPDQGAGSR